jgi:hypothetical protein
MHVKRNDLNAKSRMKGDFHVRFRERLRVKFPWSTRHPMAGTLPSGYQFHADRDYLLPIPPSELELNKKLKQNPKW